MITYHSSFRKNTKTLDKLFHYGIRGIAHECLESYMTDRFQYVSYNGSNSSSQKINCGVPQGSILGPLLFLIYINDLSSVSKILTSILFADDTTLIYSHKNLDSLIKTFNVEMHEIVNWLNANRLSLNLDKTKFMIFRPKGKLSEPPKLIVNNTQIKQVKKFKFLGVFIDEQLTWFDHIKYISSKCRWG